MAWLELADGSRWHGSGFGARRRVKGEVVVSTAMTGYGESLSDPSYAGQILVLTVAHVGSHWLRGEELQAERPCCAGLIVNSYAPGPGPGLADWLAAHGIPALAGVDTRLLTLRLRDSPLRQGTLQAGPAGLQAKVQTAAGPPQRRHYPGAGRRVVLIDCGGREALPQLLQRLGLEVLRLPWQADFAAIDADGWVISSGPGDPACYGELIARLRPLLARGRPLLGICLGCQLLALAAGARTEALGFGHRGCHQPCLSRDGGWLIATQNHGYAVRPDSLPPDWEVWLEHGLDHSVEGIRHRRLPCWGLQFHPEGAPGPQDGNWLLQPFLRAVHRP